jgi:hypothetical protein
MDKNVYSNGIYTVDSAAPPCGSSNGTHTAVVGAVDASEGAVTVDLRLDPSTGTSTITLSMSATAAGQWVGVAFNASSMADAPYAIIADAPRSTATPQIVKVQERKLGDHFAGDALASSVTVVSDSTVKGKRVLVLTRPLAGPTASHYSFVAAPATLPVLVAVGTSGVFTTAAVHKFKVAAVLPLAAPDASVCLCRDTSANSGTIGGRTFNNAICADYPTSTLLSGSEYGLNGICNISTYGGGLICCGGYAVYKCISYSA